MAFTIPLSSINKTTQQRIHRDLSFRVPLKDTLHFYRLQHGILSIPFQYALRHFQVTAPIRERASFEFRGTLRPTQIEDCRTALEKLQHHGSVLLNFGTGVGKTVCAVYLASRLGYRTLVLHNRNNLGEQWHNEFFEQTGLDAWIVGSKFHDSDIIICGILQFEKIKAILPTIGVFIIDEAHLFCTPSAIPVILSVQPRFLIALTATPERSDGLGAMLKVLVGENWVIRAAQVEPTIIKLKTGIQIQTRKQADGKLDWQHLVHSLNNCDKRNKIIEYEATRYPGKVLILTWDKKHAKMLTELLAETTGGVELMTGTKKRYQNCRILVGTISKIGVGFDEKATCMGFDGDRIETVLLVASTKNPSLLQQLIGRAFRTSQPRIIDFVDQVPLIQNHWRARKQVYQSLRFRIVEMPANQVADHEREESGKEETTIEGIERDKNPTASSLPIPIGTNITNHESCGQSSLPSCLMLELSQPNNPQDIGE